MIIIIGAALLGAVVIFAGQQEHVPDQLIKEESPMANLTLELPDHTRPLRVAVTIGALPKGADLILETPEGDFVGAIGFFGEASTSQGGQPQVVVLQDGLARGEIAIVGRVVVNGASRAATREELQGIQIVSE